MESYTIVITENEVTDDSIHGLWYAMMRYVAHHYDVKRIVSITSRYDTGESQIEWTIVLLY